MILSNTSLRIVSGAIIGSIFIVSIIWFHYLFCTIMLIIAAFMLCEWYQITHQSLLHSLIGIIVISMSISSIIVIALDKQNNWLLLAYFILIWSVDIFAMVGGKTLAGPKLAPILSPKKTWSGLFVGVAASIGNLYIMNEQVQQKISTMLDLDSYNFIIAVGLVAILAQVSDLFVSYFKRYYKIKDTGSVIPGHGGVLDRFDSIILTAPILCVYHCLHCHSL